MELTSSDQLQLLKDVSEIKGMLSSSLGALGQRVTAIEEDIDESREVHSEHDKALAAHAARLAVVEATAKQNSEKLAQAGDQTRANAALIVSIVVGLAGVGAFLLNILNQIGATR